MAQGLGTTYHEAGTLWMGDNPPPPSPTPAGRFHHITNAYACDQEHHYAGIDPGEKINPLSAPSTSLSTWAVSRRWARSGIGITRTPASG
jgi:hypothetical protein